MSSFRASTLSPAASETGSVRQSPFRRQNSQSPAPSFHRNSVSMSPTKPSNLSPTKTNSSLSPEKASPFVRRPSQNGQAASSNERPSSPFARPTSSFGVPQSPAFRGATEPRKASIRSGSDESEELASRQQQQQQQPATPVRRISPPGFDAGADKENIEEPDSPSPFDGAARSPSPLPIASPKATLPSQASLRPAAHRTVTSSTTSTIRAGPPLHSLSSNTHRPAANFTKPAPAPAMPTSTSGSGGNNYTSLPPPLLHALRSSFEVLDPSATGSITASTLQSTLSQIGLDPSTLPPSSHFFPANAQTLNLSTYLNLLSAPLSQLSRPDELLAAFGAFDVDDSGQINAEELRKALLMTAPEPGEEDWRMSEREVEGVMRDFVGRRAFGAPKGLGGGGGKGKGEVFRYREFMGALGGGGGSGGMGEQDIMG